MVWEVWQHVVAERRAYVHDDPNRSAFECDVGDARVLVEEAMTSALAPEATVSARFPVAAGPRFTVRGGRILDGVGKLFGDRQVAFDHGFFAEMFVVKSDEPAATRAVWSTRAVELMCLCRQGRVESDGHKVEFHHHGLVLDAVLVDAAIDLVAELVRADIFGMGALRSLPGAIYHPPSGPWDRRTRPWVEIHAPKRVDFAPIMARTKARTWAGRAYDEREAFSVRVGRDGTLDGEIPGGLPPRQQRYLGEIGAGLLAAEEGVLTFTWPRIETSPARLMAAAKLLATFPAMHGFGVFR